MLSKRRPQGPDSGPKACLRGGIWTQWFPAVIDGRDLAGYSLDFGLMLDICVCVHLHYLRFAPSFATLRLCVFALKSFAIDVTLPKRDPSTRSLHSLAQDDMPTGLPGLPVVMSSGSIWVICGHILRAGGHVHRDAVRLSGSGARQISSRAERAARQAWRREGLRMARRFSDARSPRRMKDRCSAWWFEAYRRRLP